MNDKVFLTNLIEATNRDIVMWSTPNPSDLRPNLRCWASFDDCMLLMFGTPQSYDKLEVVQLENFETIYVLGSIGSLPDAIKQQLSRRYSQKMDLLNQVLEAAL